MNGNMKKFGTLLATLALFASMLLVTIPVGAAPVKDVYVKSIGLPATQPTVGDNVTLTTVIRSTAQTNMNCSGVQVTFSAVNGSTTIALSVVINPANTTNSADTTVTGWWDSKVVIPNADLVYTIKVDLQLTGDTNQTNNTMTTTSTIDWKAPKLAVTAIAGAAAALIGDDYTATVTVKNIGDADFGGLQNIDVAVGSTVYGTTELNCTATALAPAATKDVAVIVNTTTFTAGDVNMTASLIGGSAYKIAAFAEKVTAVYVTDITFSAGPYKGTTKVTITATFLNEGTMDAVDMPVKWFFGTTEIVVTPAVIINVTADNTTETTASIEWTIPDSTTAKTYTINVTVEGDTVYMTKDLACLPTPHTTLSVVDIAFTPQTLVQKDDIDMTQPLTITVTVKNDGDKDAVNAVITLKMAGTTLNTTMVNVTKGGGTATATFAYVVKTPKDTANLSFEASVALGADTPAAMVKNISVPGHLYRPIYQITDLTVTPVTQERNLVAKISVSVKNVGDLVGASVDVKILAGSTELKTVTLKNVTIGGTSIAVFNWTIPGTFALGVVKINASVGSIVKSVNFTVSEFKKPTLAVAFVKDKKGKVQGYSSSAADGKYKVLKVQVVVTNSGTADAKNVNVTIKDAKGTILGSTIVPTISPSTTGTTVTVECKIKAGTSAKGSAFVTYDGVHAIAGLDKGLTASDTASLPSIKVVKTPGFEGVVLVAAVAVALVVLSRRKK